MTQKSLTNSNVTQSSLDDLETEYVKKLVETMRDDSLNDPYRFIYDYKERKRYNDAWVDHMKDQSYDPSIFISRWRDNMSKSDRTENMIYDIQERLNRLENELDDLRREKQELENLVKTNPSVAEAYKVLQTMMILAKEEEQSEGNCGGA